MLPHWDRSCRSNLLSYPVTVYWHRANQSPAWPCEARRLAGYVRPPSIKFDHGSTSWLWCLIVTASLVAVESEVRETISATKVAFVCGLGGRNSSLVVFGLAVHSVACSILLWGNFPVEGIFTLELTWVQTPFPQKNSFKWEYKPRSSLHTCISSHGLKRSCPRRVNDGNKNTPNTHHPRRGNVTTLMVGLKNGHIRKNLTPKWWTPEI